MARIYARDEGTAIRIDNYGEATFETPAVVPAAVAKKLASDERLRIEADDAPVKARPAQKGRQHTVSDLAVDVKASIVKSGRKRKKG